MAQATLELEFSSKLDCGKCDEVLIDLYDPTLIVANTKITDPDQILHSIKGTISDFTCVNNHVFKYTITYDDSEVTRTLTECDVKRICCASCVLPYVEALIARLEAEID